MGGPHDPFTYNTIEVPTVVGLLRNILTQYPDNGQIIKELVQNAEDAGATKVEVMHVESHLTYPEAEQVVQRFLEGPSLCLYNNAVFSEEDWHGIRKLSDSIKKNNPLQVGQFGLGFKSVFHITDYVTIISGQQVLFMDPGEPEDKMCRSLPLEKLSEVLPATACQRAFGNYLTPQHLATGIFPATIFWFPLRQHSSKISDTIYTPKHVKCLFESFAVEGNVCLTFLKSLEEITIGKMKEEKITVTQCMKITSSNLLEMRNKRQAFRQHLQQCQGSPPSALTCSYQATLQTGVGRTKAQNMRILHFLPGKHDREWMKWGGRDSSKHVPLVGVAVPTSPTSESEAKGHIFSFLPLPPDPSNQTHLPIQVNGAFILNQNRRQVKWRTSESSQESDVIWNEELAVEVVARAYTELLKELLQETKNGTIDVNAWYMFLPDLSNTSGRWQQMAKKVWHNLLLLPIISSEVRGFLKVQDVLTTNDLKNLKPEVAETVKRVLCSQSLPLATVPDRVQASMRVLDQQLVPITPQCLRDTLKTCGNLKKGWNPQHLLCYAAKDKNYQDLSGLPLLPLQDQSWTAFMHSGAAVFLCTQNEAKALLGLEGQIASVQVPQQVQKILQDVSESGRTQVCRFHVKQHGPRLLHLSFMHVQRNQPSQQQVGEWLSKVWNILQHLDLCSVEHIPLLPTSQPPEAMSLTSLTPPVVVQKGNCKLSRPQVEVLGLLGVVVVPVLPSYIKHIELQGYLYSSDCYGTTQALNKVARLGDQSQTAWSFSVQKTEEQRKALSSLIDTNSIQPHLQNFLAKLKMFNAQDKNNCATDVSLEDVNLIAPEITGFPVQYPETLLVPSLPQERTLALALNAVQLSRKDLCVRALRSSCSDENVSRLTSYILNDAELVRSKAILEELRNTRFVPNITGSLCRPSELYDPDDDDRDALIGETQKADDSFRQYYPLLRSLGLRKVQEMPWDDFVSLIKHQQNALLSEANRAKKSVGLLRALNRHDDCIRICQAVRRVPFVYGVSSRPLEYPSNLEWATPLGLLCPQDLKSCKYSDVLGSAVAVVKCHDVPSVAEVFGWEATPEVDPVIKHLRNIIAVFQLGEWNRYFNLIKKTYCQLAVLLDVGVAQLATLKSECCVFTEQGFRTPAEVYIFPDNEDMQLQPYLHPLPLELRESERLFLHLGCAPRQSIPLLLTVLEGVRKQHQDGSSSSREVERDRRLVVSVLDRLQHHIAELRGPLLVPVRTQDDTLELAEAEESAYTEAATEWIDSDELNIKVVHQCVSTNLAKALGVAPLQNFLAAGGEAVMEWGQREPLTTRLHNLLRQYRDGVSVLKELVQNADDAGATTVRLLYDQRQNEGSRTLVLGSGMAECQGPALWAYNDALFSEQDFVNLREVGGGTKELQPTKIGKFGLGFCSVYNLTDVPSFVSGSSYVVFDPHMTHMNHRTNSPGIRFNFTDRRNSYMLRTLQGQFQPFGGVFGCDIQECGSFRGTLFRLPFRTLSQASTSKISDTCYTHRDVVQLLTMFSGVVGQLLLFTQHVSSISVCHLRATATNPTEMVELFSASRSQCQPVPVPGLTPTVTGPAQSLLERAAALFSRQQQKFVWNGGILEQRSIAEISVQHSRGGADLCSIEEGKWRTTWVVSWHSGSGRSCFLAETHGGKALPLSAVAVPVTQGISGWQPQCLLDLPPGFYHEGYFHCFLPLPVKTFLPVQINGVLEVASDRTNLLAQTEDDRHALSWNATLLEDSTVRAHLGLVEALRHLGVCAGSLYYATWPLVGCGGGILVEGLAKSFYETLEQEDVKVFQCGHGDWHPLSRCLFLEEDFLLVDQVGDIAFEFLETCLYLSSEMRLVRVPKRVLAGFDRQVLSKHTITQEVFFRQYFIPHLSEKILTCEKRDQLTLHMLDSGHHHMELLRSLPCIPTQPHGTLKSPHDLISPKKRIARMFSIEDERFPLQKFFDSSRRLTALHRLGMNTHSLPRELVVERAESVSGLALICPECAKDRVMELLHYISTQEASHQEEVAVELKSVPFLPVMPKPENWSVAWHGEHPVEKESQCCLNHREATSKSHSASLVLDCPSVLCLSVFKPLVGSSHLLFEDYLNRTSERVLEKLGVTVRPIDLPLRSVVEQLCVFSTAPPDSENASMCHVVYEHLEDLITHVRRGKILNLGNIDDVKKLREKKILVTNQGFKEPQLFALHSESDCAPDLFSARTEGLEKYRCLMDILGIKESFEFDVVMKVIQKKRETFVDKRLGEDEVSQVSRLLNVLFKVKKSDVPLAQVLHLPDSQGYMRSTRDLCIDDGIELSSGQFLCLHRSISVSQDMWEWLGIKSKTRKRLADSSNRLCFGQKEPLTTRLRNILNEYPCDSGIMKELLQNADDAGATEVTFYKDFRRLPDKKLFDRQWAPIQGPALSVFNNKGFTQRDLQSIQDLGNSSKREDPATTGQYGIGFNAVYHLTDAPSFLTRGPQVPQGETLCMFDPHCWYDPLATQESPGVQLVNLNDLREDHPDSFIGYLEEELSEEGTVFRLPLRTTKDSLISKEILKEEDIHKILQEFESDMPQCLLFLRNVRKISIKRVQDNGRCEEEYCVKAHVPENSHIPVLFRKHGDMQETRDPSSVDMVRTSYRMDIQDSKGRSSQWLVVQQMGVEVKENLPEIVKEAFRLGTLNLLPHGGVALLLAIKPHPNNYGDLSAIFSTSCYLPLPVKSGLPFSINGHFTLSSSRRELWTGCGDAKGLWNEWLLKELLVPAAVYVIEQFRILTFPGEDESYITEQICMNKVRRFHNVLPLAQNANSERWRNFVKWFYEHVRNEELLFFDSFTPETDLPPRSPDNHSSWRGEPSRENRKGSLRWHAFHASGDEYPVCFGITSKEHENSLQKIADIFRRLGMKLSSEGMYNRLVMADPEFECPLLTPDVGLEFIKSWDKDINDRCIPGVDNKVSDTPFLKPDNVLSILQYVMEARGFTGACVDKLPLLLTNDGVLGCFSVQKPVFLSSFCNLLPDFRKEFTFLSLVTVIERVEDKFKDVVKKFTPADLGERLPHVFDASDCAPDAKLPLKNEYKHKQWLNTLWRFIVKFIEKEYCQKQQMDWTQSKAYILSTLGNWAFYPVREREETFLIPIKDAWQVLDLFSHLEQSVFQKLPVPVPFSSGSKDHMRQCNFTIEKPYIPHQLQLAATLTDPAAVLELLYFHRESVNSFLQECVQNEQGEVQTQEILVYLGKHCQTMSRIKIRSLQIFREPSGRLNTLLGRKLVVLAESILKLDQLEDLCAELSLLIVLQPNSVCLTNLYTYIEPNCMIRELEVYTRIILPNIRSLNEAQRTFYLKHLNKNLRQSNKEWSEEQQMVIDALKLCPFIEHDGTLKTGDQFYDPLNPVFLVMGVANLPEAWMDQEWQNLLRLAGMVHKVTPEKFVEFAYSLSASDEEVEHKSEVLCTYLNDHHDVFQPKMSEILDIEFLVPKICDDLERILPHHRTDSGLVAFSEGANPKFVNIIWSTRSLFPSYAMKAAKNFQKHYGNKVNIDTLPVADILEHIVKFCSSMQKNPEKSPKVVEKVMESIYNHLSKSEGNEFKTLKEREIPIIHIPDHKVFVSINLVVESLEEEILPHLFKAPVFYGKFFGMLRKLGMLEAATVDTYAQVLRMIRDSSKQKALHPQETKRMKMAVQGLVKLPYKLKNLSIPELYLPARDETLRCSTQMFVADSNELLLAVEKTFHQPVFVGFKALDIMFDDYHFVNLLPRNLQPKFLSEACKENLQLDGMVEEASPLVGEILELLHSDLFKVGVLRILNHYKILQGSSLTEKEKNEVVGLLGRVTVRQFSSIKTTITLYGNPVGQRNRSIFQEVSGEGDHKMFTLYLSKRVTPRLIPTALHKMYAYLLPKWNIGEIKEFSLVFQCYGKPHEIHKCLDENDIRGYTAQTPAASFFKCDVGNYLEERFLPLLDNGFTEFYEKEIVCMRKYLCRNERGNPDVDDEDTGEDDIFVIVEVVRLVEKHSTCEMLNTYEVNTSKWEPCLVIAKACQLYCFVRKGEDRALAEASATQNVQSEEEIYREIRKQLKEIWQVKDEQERRHLLRRLQFKWHPDKNPDQVELCTRVMQYMMSLIARLERGEEIPDEEDPANSPQTTPREAHFNFFRPPPRWYRNRNNPPRRPRSDLPEAHRWYRQARSDLETAERLSGESPSWAVFMCYQAAEKVLLAVLYVQDMDKASEKESDGPLMRTLSNLAQHLGNPRAVQLANAIQEKAGGFLAPLYPTFGGCPQDRYTRGDANHMLILSRELLQVLGQRIG